MLRLFDSSVIRDATPLTLQFLKSGPPESPGDTATPWKLAAYREIISDLAFCCMVAILFQPKRLEPLLFSGSLDSLYPTITISSPSFTGSAFTGKIYLKVPSGNITQAKSVPRPPDASSFK